MTTQVIEAEAAEAPEELKPVESASSPSDVVPRLVGRLPVPLQRVAKRLASWGAPEELEALRWWILTRVAAVWVASQAAWLFSQHDFHIYGELRRWYIWDVQHFAKIAMYGYDGPPVASDNYLYEAFFPGMPGLLKLVHFVIPSWVIAGMAISFVAGAVAVVALTRIATDDFGPVAGARAAIIFSVSPMMVFTVAGYTEALFLGLALPAWLLARKGRWEYATLLAAGASCVRVTGLFLAAGLATQYLAQWLPTRFQTPGSKIDPKFRHAPWFALPVLPVALYFTYLKIRTDDWRYWFEAQRVGWGREYKGFQGAFDGTWNLAFGPQASANLKLANRTELVAVAIGAVLIIVLLALYRYGEAVYVAASVVALSTSSAYYSVPRAALLWWPLWIGLGALAAHPRFGNWFFKIYLFLSVPIAAIFVAGFTTGRWVG